MAVINYKTSPNFWINQIPIYGDLILSPMDGVSDSPFRSLVRSLGSAMSYTEFINGIDVVYGHPNLQKRLQFTEYERPVAFQLLDNNVDRLLESALRLQKLGPDLIDLNLGCCAKSVSARGAGAGLLKDPLKIAEIIHKLTNAVDIPITAKIRLGWDEKSQNYIQVAKIIEENGARLIAVHGRTRVQAYDGVANWDAIAEIKNAVTIPVIANGDVKTVADIDRIKAHTGCDGVMIGRAAVSNPWIFTRLDRQQVSIEQVHQTMAVHLQSLLDFYGSPFGMIMFRKFAKRYLQPYSLEKDQIYALMTCREPQQFISLLDQIFTIVSV
ncbi:MAG: tRNA-dihydrouridine synthase family protein [Anaerolineaceae bacterium]|nr:tRNA-dihydrouridine synthase family protein [Anaerolineaceae bacterium]